LNQNDSKKSTKKVEMITVPDEEHLRSEVLRSARSFPHNFPVILERYNETDPSAAPMKRKFSAEDLDKYVEVIQEFAQEFPSS
jgi:hypothetical protein